MSNLFTEPSIVHTQMLPFVTISIAYKPKLATKLIPSYELKSPESWEPSFLGIGLNFVG